MTKTVILTALYFLLAWVCFRVKATAAMVHRPMNRVVRTGQSIEMLCRWTDSNNESNSIEWYHTPVGTDSTEHIINREYEIVNPIFNGSTLNGDVMGQKLKIMSARVQHAGLYTCTTMVLDNEGSMDLKRASAQVVILDADPVCEMKTNAIQKENSLFELCCVVSYTGSMVPSMKWRMANGDNKAKERSMKVTPVISKNIAISGLSIVADSALNGSRFICETVFEVPANKFDLDADNSTNYHYAWNSSYIQVLYGPRNLMVIPAGDVFYPGDTLTCAADGNPKPDVLWLNLNSNAVISGPTVIINEEMIRDEPYRFLCRATNPATDQTQEFQTGFSVKRRCMNSDDTLSLLKILLAVTLCVSAVIIATLSVYIRVTKRKRRDNTGPVVGQQTVEESECNAGNTTKTPLSRVSRYNFSLPLPTVQHQTFDEPDYLPPRPLSSADYDEIPYAQAATAENAVYLDMSPESSNHPTSVPLDLARPVNAYRASADVGAKTKVYETLRSREK